MKPVKEKINLEGDLEEITFPSLIEFLHERNLTGRIVLRRGELTKVVFMVEGKPVNIDSTLRDETLGRYLIKKQRINEEEFEKSFEIMIEQNIQQGAALVKLGVLSARELYHEVKAQTREKLLSCFAWTTGSFGFYPEVDFVEDMYRFEMSMPRVMRDGIYRFFPPGAVERELAKVRKGPVVPVPDFMERISDFELGEDESEFILHINGSDDLLTLKKKEKSYPFAPKLLYLLLVCGLIGPEGKTEEALRRLSKEEIKLPPIEDFVVPAVRDTSPEVVEEEDLPDMEAEMEAPSEGEEAVLEEEEAGDEEAEAVLKEQEDEFNSDEVMDDHDFRASPEREDIIVEEEPLEEEEEEAEQAPEAAEMALEHPVARVVESAAEKKDESEILEFYMGLKSADFFSLLQLKPDADSFQVTEAYRRMRSEFEKGRYKTGMSGEALAKLEEIHAQIIRAYETLRTPLGRRQYLAKLKEESKPKELAAQLKAEQYLQQGVQFVRRRDWPNAQSMFEKAVELNPEEPEYLGYLGWTIYSNPELDLAERRDRAKTLIRQAIDMNPNMDSSRVFLGKIMKEEGKVKEAVEQFEAAFNNNKNCREAEREIKSHEQGEW